MKQEIKIIKGLLAIAKLAMPDTYFATDRRVRAARKYLKQEGSSSTKGKKDVRAVKSANRNK